jgi:hypothetical protein
MIVNLRLEFTQERFERAVELFLNDWDYFENVTIDRALSACIEAVVDCTDNDALVRSLSQDDRTQLLQGFMDAAKRYFNDQLLEDLGFGETL